MANLVRAAISTRALKIFLKAMETAGLMETLSSTGPITVFAPSDVAFSKISRDTLERLLSQQEQLVSLLKFHLVAASIYSEDISLPREYASLEGEMLYLHHRDKGFMVNSAHIVHGDIRCENGVIHIIDQVLLPSSLQKKLAA